MIREVNPPSPTPAEGMTQVGLIGFGFSVRFSGLAGRNLSEGIFFESQTQSPWA